MAENKNKRKSQRKFGLEKPVEHHFDIEKDVQEPVTTVDVMTEPVKQEQIILQEKPIAPRQNGKKHPTGNMQLSATKNGNGEKRNSAMWIIIAIIIAIIAVLAYFFTGGKEKDMNVADPFVEVGSQDGGYSSNSMEIGEDNANSDNEVFGETDESSGAQSTLVEINDASVGMSNQETVSIQTPTNISSSYSVEQMAKDVLRGVYGNNPERRKNLGSNYDSVQKLVNEMYYQMQNAH